MSRRLTKKRHEEWEAAVRAEDDRVRRLGNLFSALPECPQKAALLEAMSDRVIELYNDAKFEQGDAVLEFLPNDYARQLLDWYFDDNANTPFPPPAAPSKDEATQPGQIQGEPQQPGGPDGQRSGEAVATP